MFKSKDEILHLVYSLGAAVVILGAFFKMTHTTFGGTLNPNWILGAGLITEVIIFTVSAFNPPKTEENYAWENVYPELLDKDSNPAPRHLNNANIAEIKELETSLSSKLDQMLVEAKLDVSLFERLRNGIEKFSTSVDQINQTVDVSATTHKYNEQMGKAAHQMESLNALYALQLENGKVASEFQTKYVSDLKKTAEYSEKFGEELQGITSNLNNLNRVYGGMLSAMKS